MASDRTNCSRSKVECRKSFSLTRNGPTAHVKRREMTQSSAGRGPSASEEKTPHAPCRVRARGGSSKTRSDASRVSCRCTAQAATIVAWGVALGRLGGGIKRPSAATVQLGGGDSRGGDDVGDTIVSLHDEQTTPEAIWTDIKIMASTSAVELGRLEPGEDEPRPTGPRANEPDPRDPSRDSAPPQIIINHGRHAIVASDLSTQIHGELHTSQLGTFSGGICR